MNPSSSNLDKDIIGHGDFKHVEIRLLLACRNAKHENKRKIFRSQESLTQDSKIIK